MIVSSTRGLLFAQVNVALQDFKLMTPLHGLRLRAVADHYRDLARNEEFPKKSSY